MRWYRTDQMDELPAPPAPFRADKLRDAVDRLPKIQRHLIERTFFGGQPLQMAADELGLEIRRARRYQREALEALKAKVLKDHGLRSMRPAPVGTVGDGPVPVARNLALVRDDT
jgi:DNA-directed RNA polymerase specialized sigma24 family protein